MKYEIQIIGWYRNGQTYTRISDNRECALNIFKQEYKRALDFSDMIYFAGYLYKVYKNGAKTIIKQFDFLVDKNIK